MKRKGFYYGLVLTISLLGSKALFSQSVIRQSVGTIGATYQLTGLIIQQSIGQPYATGSYYSNGIENRPGFIQPNEFELELVNSSFLVSINAYPNPATYTIRFNSSISLEDVTVSVFGMDGQMIFQREVQNLNDWELNCQSWVNGTYLIMISDLRGNKYQSKVIKL